jgi:putative colanic acid biosynthesis glycosyltransferase WcaI
MRLLLVNLQFPPDTNSTGRLMSQIGKGLAEFGHEVTVVTTFPHYENFRIWEGYRGKLFDRRREDHMDIVRLYTYAPGKKSMINRMLSYMTFNALAAVVGILSRKRWDVILCTNGSFFTGLTGWFIGKAKCVPFIYNVQDLYPDVPIRAGQLRSRFAIATLQRIEKFMYRKAAHITVIAQSFRDNLLSKGVPAEKISIIPNFVDTDFVRPLPKANDFGQQHGLADKFVVTHAGNLGYVYDLDTMLDAASLLSSEKDILFLIVGNGVAKPELQKKADELNLDNVRFMPFQPHENLPWMRASSDVQVSLYKNGAANDSFPSKVYEIMASGRPLVASSEDDSGVEQLVKNAECGLCVRPGNAEQLAKAVLNLYRDSSLRDRMGQCGRQYAEKYYSRGTAVVHYTELLMKFSAHKTSY